MEIAPVQLAWHGEVIVSIGAGEDAPNTLRYWPHPLSGLVTIIYKAGLFTATEASRGRMETASNKRVIYIHIQTPRGTFPYLDIPRWPATQDI